MTADLFVVWDSRHSLWWSKTPHAVTVTNSHTPDIFQAFTTTIPGAVGSQYGTPVPWDAAIAAFNHGFAAGGAVAGHVFTPVPPHGIPDNITDGRWLLWDMGEHTWRSDTADGLGTTQARHARTYPSMYAAVADACESELPFPMTAVANLEHGQLQDALVAKYASALADEPSTVHTAESADRFVDQLAGVLDEYAGLANVVLDRHFRISVCGWDIPGEGRTVADVMTEILHHVRTEHT